ncbi:MAG: formylglycine-generating enzyme family protein [Magnetococcales bacterium]|nr:formylglycine-generating enzyme family protein [Magnetococcales bacterium]
MMIGRKRLGLGLALLAIMMTPLTAWAFLVNEWDPLQVIGVGKKAPEQAIPGKPWHEPVSGMDFLWMPGGCFKMGSPPSIEGREDDETPLHQVCVTGYWIGVHEVTQGQWRRIMRNNPARFKKGDAYPVERVAWEDTETFLGKLNLRYPGQFAFRLPTEAEWEFACRDRGERVRYAGGSDLDRGSWHRGNSGDTTQRTQSRRPTRMGLFDMSGNVWEWTHDAYQMQSYRRLGRDNPTLNISSPYRVIRGGGFGSQGNTLRCANRGFELFSTKRSDLGLRLVRAYNRAYSSEPPSREEFLKY